MLVKTTRVTNPRNVLVQIPSFIVANWNLRVSDKLEVHYNESKNEVTIRPHVQRGSGFNEGCEGVAGAAAPRRYKDDANLRQVCEGI